MLIKEEKEMQAMRQQDQMKKAQSIARKYIPESRNNAPETIPKTAPATRYHVPLTYPKP